MKLTLFAVPAMLALAACRLSDPVVCPAVIHASVRVTAQDSVSGANVTPGASVVLRNATYTDSVVAPPVATVVGVGSRTGTFTLTVRQAGYQVWTRTGVKVPQGRCGAGTVDLVARLKPAA